MKETSRQRERERERMNMKKKEHIFEEQRDRVTQGEQKLGRKKIGEREREIYRERERYIEIQR